MWRVDPSDGQAYIRYNGNYILRWYEQQSTFYANRYIGWGCTNKSIKGGTSSSNFYICKLNQQIGYMTHDSYKPDISWQAWSCGSLMSSRCKGEKILQALKVWELDGPWSKCYWWRILKWAETYEQGLYHAWPLDVY